MDTPEFEELSTKHRRAVVAYAYSCCRDFSLAEDIVQDALIIAYEKRDAYRPDSSFAAWLIGIARNVWFREREKLIKRGEHVPMDEAMTAHASVLFDRQCYENEVWEVRRAALSKCMERLQTMDRRLIELSMEGKQRYEQIARAMERTTGWVKIRMWRIRQQLSQCVKDALKAGGE